MMGKHESENELKPGEVQNFLQAMYKEQSDQARQHESLRQQSTTIAITISGVILTAATATAPSVMQGLCNLNIPWLFAAYGFFGIFMIGLGWFGRILSLKHYERNRFHTIRAGWYRTEIEKMTGRPELGAPLRDGAEKMHEKEWEEERSGFDKKIPEMRAHELWAKIYNFIIVIGVIFIIISFSAAAFVAEVSGCPTNCATTSKDKGLIQSKPANMSAISWIPDRGPG